MPMEAAAAKHVATALPGVFCSKHHQTIKIMVSVYASKQATQKTSWHFQI
jgi:hypothetical protein